MINKIREKLPPDNDDVYVIYNHEDNSYELKTDNKKMKKNILLMDYMHLIKKIKDKKRFETNKKKTILNC